MILKCMCQSLSFSQLFELLYILLFYYRNRVETLPFETRKNILSIAVSPNGVFFIASDIDGRAILLNYPTRSIISQINFKAPAFIMKFSPDSRFHIRITSIFIIIFYSFHYSDT